ncbi:hypothetical protein BGZ49_003907, partial [Haplosporangium sp. Z 27]
MMETPEDGQIQLGPVWLSPTEAAAVTEMSQAQVDSSLPRVISTDGSFINAGTPQAAMAFGVVDQSGIIPQVVRGRTDGHASSTKAELMGLLAAILATPSEQDVQIELDNKSVVQQYQQLVHSRADTLPRKRLRSTYAGLWAVIHDLVAKRMGKVTVKWVKGHNGNIGNELADKEATQAVRCNTTPWRVDLSQQEDIHYFARCHSDLVELDLRQLLKQQTTIRRHHVWTTQRRVKMALGNIDDIEWRSTLSIVHDKRPVHTFFSNAKDTRARTHHIKKLH